MFVQVDQLVARLPGLPSVAIGLHVVVGAVPGPPSRLALRSLSVSEEPSALSIPNMQVLIYDLYINIICAYMSYIYLESPINIAKIYVLVYTGVFCSRD